jgi:hemerythrin-like domain-containing protein
MATKSGSGSRRASGTGTSKARTSKRPAFAWNGNQAGVIAAAALAGAAVGVAASLGRKLVVQGFGATGDWAEALAAEHEAVLALFDKIEATGDNQAAAREHILIKIKNALGKHALEEENVIYPALREANSVHDADALNGEHGYVKTYLFELENMPKGGEPFLAKIRELRAMLEAHMRMEENEVFPALRESLSEEINARLSAAVHREGMKLA